MFGEGKKGGFRCCDRNSKSPLSYRDIMSLDRKGKNNNKKKNRPWACKRTRKWLDTSFASYQN